MVKEQTSNIDVSTAQMPDQLFLNRIYVLSGVNARPVDDLQVRADYAKLQVLYEKWKDRSEDEYRSWLKVWNNDRYKVASCDAGYYLTEKDARRARCIRRRYQRRRVIRVLCAAFLSYRSHLSVFIWGSLPSVSV